MDTFRVRLNCIDYYQAVPHDEFDPPVPRASAQDAPKNRPTVSVLRVFGATEMGQKVLMHVHGAFQYTYIEYSGSLLPQDVDVAIRTLHLSIDHALALSFRKNVYEGKHQYVAHITLVKGVPFYGYHVGYKFYLKIYLLNPRHMTRLADLFREGAVMKRVLQPYESHMQYIAQWMCDYNLYGCAYLECDKVKFRAPVPKYLDLTNNLHPWHDRSILPENISDEFVLPKQSNCALEVDICVQDILNRDSVEPRSIHHDFIERLKPIPVDAKLVQSMAGLWKDETRRRKARMGIKDPNSSPFPPEVLVSMSADPRNTGDGGWIHEEEYREKISRIAAEEKERCDDKNPEFTSFVKPLPLESTVQTALQSAEDLYPHNMPRESVDHQDQEQAKVLVDEDVLQDMKQEGFGSDEFRPSDHVQASRPDNAAEPPSSRDRLVSSPVSSSEYGKYGIRQRGDLIDEEADAFEVPEDYRNGNDTKGRERQKKARFAMPPFHRRKRRKLLTDDNTVLGGRLTAEDESDFNDSGIEDGLGSVKSSSTRETSELNERLSSHQAVKQPRGSQASTLSFPVVKDPSDPSTIARLSQGSTPSQKQVPSSQRQTQSSTARKTPLKSSFTNVTKSPESATTPKTNETLPEAELHLLGLPKPKPDQMILAFRARPPPARHVTTTMGQYGLPNVIYQEAYYSKEKDVPDQAREYAGREFKLESTTVPYLPAFDSTGTSPATFGRKPPILLDRTAEEIADNQRRKRCTHLQWSIAQPPPRRLDVQRWIEDEGAKDRSLSKSAITSSQQRNLSQIEGATQKNKHGFKYSQKQNSTHLHHETQYMSLMSLEVHVNTRGSLAPNPEYDEIACIFWCVQSDDEDIASNVPRRPDSNMHMGVLAVSDKPDIAAKKISRSLNVSVEAESTELDALTRLVDIVRDFDPDILTGYEVHNSSWGYLIERARIKYDLNLCDEISRMKSQSHGRFGREEDRWGFNHTSTIRVTGRHTINVWRAMRGELNLLGYTMENVCFHLLHRRVPHYSFGDLTKWYQSRNPREQARVVDYFASRVVIDLEILEANELVPRTSEQARLLGVDWFSVISRGSQFKVESLMFRIAKPENLILVSPSRRQVGGQNALECLPLVMEPQSDFYTSPVLVLDFQSLYPSVMIAYNYCYSTFLGRVVDWRGRNKMGFIDYQRQLGAVALLEKDVNVAPNGIMYVKQEIRKSLLAKMLSEILETRVMVKSGMKVDKEDKSLQRLLNNRQLALKLIANVTYGYTSASFSGRMPCSEIADSIVQTGRETLERAVALIHAVEKWGAEVVYGDTDSLFVLLKGRTRSEAFEIGEEIADAVTKQNPRPVKLKFEKVYQPCVLLAKKRYVGFKYESTTQKEPEFDAKGIETVRRDGTPAEQTIEEMALKVLFRTGDLSLVKSFFQAQCAKIMRGKVSIQDFCYAREVKLGTYSDKGPPPPGALISARRMVEDPRLEPQYGERVPYVVVTGGPGARLIDRCVAPEVLLNDAQQELDAEYYISKNIIPPLERIFNLVGANVRQWYDEMPKYQRIRRVEAGLPVEGEKMAMSKKTLESYMKSSKCLVCREPLDTEAALCNSCCQQAPQSLLYLRAKLVRAQKKAVDLRATCRSCSGLSWHEEVKCDSKDCPVFYSRTRQDAALGSEEAQLLPVLSQLERSEVEEVEW